MEIVHDFEEQYEIRIKALDALGDESICITLELVVCRLLQEEQGRDMREKSMMLAGHQRRRRYVDCPKQYVYLLLWYGWNSNWNSLVSFMVHGLWSISAHDLSPFGIFQATVLITSFSSNGWRQVSGQCGRRWNRRALDQRFWTPCEMFSQRYSTRPRLAILLNLGQHSIIKWYAIHFQ